MRKVLNIFMIIFTIISATSITTIGARGAVPLSISKENFPDAYFRNYIKKNFDMDSDCKLNYEEKSNIVNIHIEDTRTASLEGIQYFFNLEKLEIYNINYAGFNDLTSIDLSNNSKLTYLDLEFLNKLEKIDLRYNTELFDLKLSGCTSLTELDLTYNKSLTTLYIWGCEMLEKVKLNSYDKLSSLFIEDSSLVDITKCKSLVNLSIKISQPSLDLSDFTKLASLFVHNSTGKKLIDLKLDNNKALEILYLYNCDGLETIDLANNTNLTELEISSCNSLKKLDLKNNKKIKRLHISNCDLLKNIDISNNKLLSEIDNFSNVDTWNIYVPSVSVKKDGVNCTLKWSKCAYVDYYQVYKAGSKSGTYKKVATTTGTSKSFKRTTTAYYKVRSVFYKPGNSSGVKLYGKFSNVDKVSKYVVPSQPVLKITTDGSKCTLKWEKCTNAQGYQIYKASTQSGTYKKVASTTSTSKTYERTSTSYYKVRSYRNNEDGMTYSKFSSIQKVAKYSKPSQPTINSNPTYTSTQYTIKWSKCSNVDGYQIYRATNPDSSYKKVATTTGTSKSFKITNKGVYYYKVRSYRKNGNENVYSKFSKPILVLNY